ncbi:phosphohistidine phosphatase [Nocardioides ginsengisegetis]|uniref:Phosphohistidine phosphatase n=1 Tax=Nocardioides ginsengisegetis TaxID=661491 RepID=A0A7W3IZJ8_9ACTN|nr:phosphohistidine phosphatase [Nocardioides ginsengisegetis]
MQQQSRVVVVVRHASAEQVGPTDAERELAPGGHDDARDAGRWLAAQGVRPDHAWVSAATRTVQTWQCLADAAGWGIEPEVDRGLYSAGPETALDLMRSTPDEARTLVVVGHNPTIAYLASMLDDGHGDQAASALMTSGFPAGAVTVFAFDGDWGDLDPASCRVVGFHVGRG